GCSLDSTINITISTVNVIEKSELERILIYPNPTTSTLRVDFENVQAMEYTITLYSIDGTMVHHSSIEAINHKIDVDLSNLRSGVYVVRLASEEASIFKKITKIDP